MRIDATGGRLITLGGVRAPIKSVMDAPVCNSSVLRSALLEQVGVPHGFSTRIGGCSSGIFASLNFGNPGDLDGPRRDPLANIQANWRTLSGLLGCSDREIVQVHQVHGDAVLSVHRGQATHATHATPDGADTKADAVVCDDAGRLVAVRVADCCPVLLSSADGSIVGAVHAGWRGVVGEVLPRAIEMMLKAGNLRPREVVGAIGPCIGAESFEVGPEVAEAFARVFGAGTALVRPGALEGKFLADLKGGLREQLLGAGVLGSMIDVREECTVMTTVPPGGGAESGGGGGGPMFFSHRRDRGLTGRMVGVIGCRGA